MEKNCINCKYNIPVTGADYGFCNHKNHLGMKACEHTLCSEYEVQEEPTYTNKEAEEVLLGIKCCTDPKSKGCSACPFARYECSCQQGFMFAAAAVVEKLQRELGGYIVDQEIWLTKNDALEKEIEELKEQKAYYWEKADTLAEDYRQLKRDAEVTEINLGEALVTIKHLSESNEELWDSYHQGYSAGYEYGKQDALTADRGDIAYYTDNSKPEVEG